ncbi:response regulator transcription factor [Acetobacter sp. TBRC 12305]|uniref:Response regulator transcription factor n=1 Tax=Acetobacter garciniae TaxID=2817435 RepID=A0A939KR72_9PROT|nr:response regulator transcription factor [Acetobacter garciniae]MBO1326499.1 response regulator transcription factor [Acetobacter garciniae]MBX0346185.1 response regulator transcription factor [Acetobacter garciniae]
MEKPDSLRIAILEDDVTFHDAMARAIAAQPDMALHAAATSRAAGLAMLDGPAADVLLADIGLPDGSGLDVVRAAVERWPDCAVLVNTTFGDETDVMTAIASGAVGYLLKDSDDSQRIADIRSVHQGGSPISPMIARRILSRFRTQLPQPAEREPSPLSGREHEVLQKISQGFTSSEIAGELQISAHTVQTHIRRIYRKLAVTSRMEAVTLGRRHGWLND